MIITIIDVSEPSEMPTKTGRTYQTIDVTYKDDQGQVKAKKLVSFNYAEVFKAIKVAVKGTKLNIVTQKNEKSGYWDWVDIAKEGTPVASTPTETRGGRVTGSNYETHEERAARQVYIVRQSSISAAVALLSVGAKSHASPEDIISVAKKFEAYVFASNEAESLSGVDALIAMEDDIPL